MKELLTLLVGKTTLSKKQIENVLSLLEEGATIPFIARYRKEMTGGADDEVLRTFFEQYEKTKNFLQRRDEIISTLKERDVLDTKLHNALKEAMSITQLEDLYRPFKEKKNTRAMKAVQNGLKPLANLLQKGTLCKEAFEKEAKKYCKGTISSVDEAILGAKDIIAERYSDDAKERDIVRNIALKHGFLEVKKAKGFQQNSIYKNYAEHSEKVAFVPSHRYLAIMRGVKEKELSLKITIDTDRYFETLKRFRIKSHMQSSSVFYFEALQDGFKRLLFPSIEREVHHVLKERSDRAAISVFGKNLTQLLMTPPVTGKVLLGVDPAFRTGCKLAVIDENAKYLDHSVIYPTAPNLDFEGSVKVIDRLVQKYGISGVAIGNGTASRETQDFFVRYNKESTHTLKYTVVSEAGASVYSASKVATQEYPDLDVTIRGAISIAQRLRDPMAALVKIDPKSLGIGQYQHDVDQKLLERKLHECVEDLVNRVGVDVNSASVSLLSYLAGVGQKVAENIVSYREEKGLFRSKEALLQVKGVGQKAYEQCAGFVRIREGKSVLDNTGVHPESYKIATTLLKNPDLDTKILCEKFGVGEMTIQDIKKELAKPGFDPRSELPAIPFRDDVTDIDTLHKGSIVSGIVRNIADFGAFIDIGLKNDGMIHISKMSEKRISHPLEALSLNQYLPRIEVIEIDRERGRVSLSLQGV